MICPWWTMPEHTQTQEQPVFPGYIPAGFPSPAADYEQASLDLHKHLIKNRPATFFVRASGDSMIGAGIHANDLLIVDRSIEPRHGAVIIAVVNGDMAVKRLHVRAKQVTLVSENKAYHPITVSPEDEFQVWGVVTYVIHAL